METTKLKYGRGRENFRYSVEMRRDWEEHQWRKHSAGSDGGLRMLKIFSLSFFSQKVL